MKNPHHLAIFVIAVAITFGSGLHAQQSLAAVQREGVALYNAGEYAEALSKFQKVLRGNPRYINARVYANKCKLALSQDRGPKNNMGDKLSKVMIPNVDFQEVPIGDALTYIRQRTTELTGGKIVPNIIFSGSTEQRENISVTMKLNRVPVTTLLKYMGTQSRCRIQYDEHAIIVTPQDNIPKPVVTPTEAPNPFQ